MLILRRRSGEAIFIGPAIRVTVLGVRNEHVRIGIDAPLAPTAPGEEANPPRESEVGTPPET